jgi:Monomeric isocitrate dehydrogenase
MKFSLDRIGLFAIMELGTSAKMLSAKMLSIVPLLAGGGLFGDRGRRLGAQAFARWRTFASRRARSRRPATCCGIWPRQMLMQRE